MQIRNRLTLQFAGIVALILLVFSIIIYQQAAAYTYNEFEGRLKDRALNTAQLLLDVEEVDESALKILRRKYMQSLPQEFIRVYDSDGRIVFKDDSESVGNLKQVINNVKKSGEYAFNINKRQFTGIRYDDDQGQFVVLASAIDKFGVSKLQNLRLVLLLGYVVAVIIIIISGRFFAKAALNPITAVVEKAEKITASNLHLRIPEGRGRDEIEKLAIAFNNMFERLQSAFDMQKSFVSNASHELRTPLTSIKGEIEVTLMKERKPEEYQKVLYSILEETSKMTGLSNGLLQLAQAGSKFNTLSFSKILIAELLLELHETIRRRNNDHHLVININNKGHEDGLFVSGSKELLMTALQNLVGNAFKFSNNQPVSIKVWPNDDNAVFIEVVDKGVGISEQEMKHVFEPFYRSDNVRAVPGHGIGLPMTEKIVKLHKGSISIDSKLGKGTKMMIKLPLLEE